MSKDSNRSCHGRDYFSFLGEGREEEEDLDKRIDKVLKI